jgi:serine/threonine protein kinase
MKYARENPRSDLIGKDNVSMPYKTFKYSDGNCFVYSYDGDISLARYILSRNLKQNIKVLSYIIRQVAEGLVYLNKAGLVHNDIRPENIVLSFQNGNQLAPKARIVGFDLAIPTTYGNSNQVDLTKKDTWSLGAVLYYLMSRSHLFPDSRISLEDNLRWVQENGMPHIVFRPATDPETKQGMASLVNMLQTLLQPKIQERLTPEGFLKTFGSLLASNKPIRTSATQLPGVPQSLPLPPGPRLHSPPILPEPSSHPLPLPPKQAPPA